MDRHWMGGARKRVKRKRISVQEKQKSFFDDRKQKFHESGIQTAPSSYRHSNDYLALTWNTDEYYEEPMKKKVKISTRQKQDIPSHKQGAGVRGRALCYDICSLGSNR
eukprot:TRINITY_DN4339_c0_g1_i2.p1 TRINITY_DN4339_c0_g1~~TRINITY_DN4339_c0_g1_i2.p1  ORF type:complete len:108 (-),score=0.15 TRINITY_DN4339_c0_g1_i2:158-481(-)